MDNVVDFPGTATAAPAAEPAISEALEFRLEQIARRLMEIEAIVGSVGFGILHQQDAEYKAPPDFPDALRCAARMIGECAVDLDIVELKRWLSEREAACEAARDAVRS